MAQRLVILNRLNKKPMNTIFVKERGYTFPALSYLDNFVKSITKYCEDYSANTVEELFQRPATLQLQHYLKKTMKKLNTSKSYWDKLTKNL